MGPSTDRRVTVLSFPTDPHPGNPVVLCAFSPLDPYHSNSLSINESFYQITDMLHSLAGYYHYYIECHPIKQVEIIVLDLL